MFRAIIIVGIGGAVGSIFRYLTFVLMSRYFNATSVFATFTANFLGCFIIGLLIGFFEKQQITNNDYKLLLVTGFCGGYTTFSTFAYENIVLFESNNAAMAFVYIAASILLSLFAVWLGLMIPKL